LKHKLIAFTLLAFSFAAGRSAFSQSMVNRAEVPFAFTAGSVQLPAGTYLIQRKPASNFISFNDTGTGKISWVLASERVSLPLDAPAKLVFHEYGSQHFLAAFMTGGGGSGSIFPTTGYEKNLRGNQPKAAKEDMIALK
jgi:hypothetical protein